MNKHFFSQFKKDIKEEHEAFDTHQESTEVITARCDHKGKVRIENGMLKCQCQAAWSGPEIETLYKLFNA
jgi:hypothetical protein